MKRYFDKTYNTIYVDMDDVLVGFSDFCVKNVGRPWNYHTNNLEHDDHEMWLFLKNAPRLYFNINPTPYAQDLWAHVNSFGCNVEILTAIPRSAYIPEAEQDKRDWCEKYLGPNVKFNVGPYSSDKWKWAKPGDILIDDRTDNIQRWINDGMGIGIRHDLENPLETFESVTANVTELERHK